MKLRLLSLLLICGFAACSNDDFNPVGPGGSPDEGSGGSTTGDGDSGDGDSGDGDSGDGDSAALCTEESCGQGQICCAADLPCAGDCVSDCTIAGCPDNLTCNEVERVCLPSDDSSMGGATGSGGSSSGGSPGSGGVNASGGSSAESCGVCGDKQVCCIMGPCAGNCVPDCREGTACKGSAVCDMETGRCGPA